MSSDAAPPGNHVRHVLALLAGLAAMASVVWAPAGLVGDLIMLVVGVAALLFAWETGTRPGPLRPIAIGGALLAGLVTIAATGVFLVALANALS